MSTTENSAKRGRPKSSNPRNESWLLRLTGDEATLIENKAKRAGKQRSKWIRETLLSA